jgi:eukaryotic-like serine/threonine-protein kinase
MTNGPSEGSGDKTKREIPERLGAYRIEELIGAGGMGSVYRALDEALQRQVALKTLLPALTADPEFVARFKREAQSAAALNHPNITQIYTIGQEGAIPFFAMELIHGQSLEALVKHKGALDPRDAAGYVLQAAKGLRHAAQKKLIHRDVKPSNLMLTEDGVVKITDFGLAKAARSETKLTATGEVLGSPGYISPEQAQGVALDARSDIYSLGATFYHLVTGRLPFEAPTPVAMIIKHMNEPLRSPRAVNPNIPYPIASAIQKMMAKRPGERFQDYDALIRELDRALFTLRPEAPGQVDAGGAAAASWAGMTGAEARGRRPIAPLARPTDATTGPARGRGASWIPILLAGALGTLIVAGVVRHLRSAPRAAAEFPAATSASGLGVHETSSGIQPQGSFTSRPVLGSGRTDRSEGLSSDERLRQRLRQKSQANLSFAFNDHEVLRDGRIKVFGRVENIGGGVASQARVRIKIFLDNGNVAAQAETPLIPPTIPPGASASFEIPMDYQGPVGTIKAEVVWVE